MAGPAFACWASMRPQKLLEWSELPEQVSRRGHHSCISIPSPCFSVTPEPGDRGLSIREQPQMSGEQGLCHIRYFQVGGIFRRILYEKLERNAGEKQQFWWGPKHDSSRFWCKTRYSRSGIDWLLMILTGFVASWLDSTARFSWMFPLSGKTRLSTINYQRFHWYKESPDSWSTHGPLVDRE